MATAGRAVVFSGTTVAVGLLALIALPLPFLRSMGYGGLLIPLVATLVAITLLPVILATIGPRLDRKPASAAATAASAFWQRWSEGVVRRRGLAALVAVAILGALLVRRDQPAPRQRRPGHDRQGGHRPRTALDALEDSGIGKGAIAPTETLVPEARRRRRWPRPRPRSRACTARSRPTGADWRRGRPGGRGRRSRTRATSPRPAATPCRTLHRRRRTPPRRTPASAAPGRSTPTSSTPSTARSR